jgi:hypothetical protein
MKKIFFLGIFMLQAALMSAQYSIEISSFTVVPGASADDAENPACFNIDINYGPNEQANMVQFNMFLPEGITIPDGYIELDSDRFPEVKEGRNMIQPFVVGQVPQTDGSILVTITTQKTYFFNGNTGAALNVYFNVDQNMEEGEYEIKIDRGVIAIKDAVGGGPAGIESVNKFTVSNTVGISSINADNQNNPVYNTAGQRVSRTNKGLYIQNGKKVVKK